VHEEHKHGEHLKLQNLLSLLLGTVKQISMDP